MTDIANTSTRPYLIRALHEWCSDNGLTPYIAAHVDGSVQVPMEFVKDNEIVLNVSYDATSALQLGNEFVSFRARFGGVPRDIMVPIDHVVAIYPARTARAWPFRRPRRSSLLRPRPAWPRSTAAASRRRPLPLRSPTRQPAMRLRRPLPRLRPCNWWWRLRAAATAATPPRQRATTLRVPPTVRKKTMATSPRPAPRPVQAGRRSSW